MKRYTYDPAPEYPSEAYRIKGEKGISWFVLGWQTESPCELYSDERELYNPDDTEQTGKLVVVMIGDDRHFLANPDDILPLAEGEYCPCCGQVGPPCWGYGPGQ